MRLAAYAQIRNEADIAHLFARHLAALYDHVLLIDHGSSDGTSEILADACRAFPGWQCWRCDIAGHHMIAFTTFALRHLFASTDADIVVIHDADEFLAVADRDELERRLAALDHPRAVGLLTWLNSIPGCFDPAVGHDVGAGFWQSEPKVNFSKVVIARSFMEATRGRAMPTMGNHWIEPDDDGPFDFRQVGHILHFPIRSASQIAQKAITGTISDLLRADRLANDNAHWLAIVSRLAEGALDDADLIGLAARYGVVDAARTRLSFADLPGLGFAFQSSGMLLADGFADDLSPGGKRPDALAMIAAALQAPKPTSGEALNLYLDGSQLMSHHAEPQPASTETKNLRTTRSQSLIAQLRDIWSETVRS